MATIAEEIPEEITTLFTNFEEQQTLLTKCTDLYKSLITHITTLQDSITIQSQTLDSKLQSLDSTLMEALDSIKSREDALPDLPGSLSSEVERLRDAALSEMEKPLGGDEAASLTDVLKSVCRRMDQGLLMKVLVGKRRQSTLLREEMSAALTECVDPERLVLDSVCEFVSMKKDKTNGLADKRWACSILVGSIFPAEVLKEGKKGKGVLGGWVFATTVVERAKEVLKEWKEVCDKSVGDGEGGEEGVSGMGPAEAAMFLEMVLGFGLKDLFDEEYYKKLMIEFCERRDVAKLAVPIFGDKTADLIEDLIKDGKEVEAIYFVIEAGLTERFEPVSLLTSSLQKSKKNIASILRKGNYNSTSTDEANSLETSTLRSIIKCTEDHKLVAEFPLESLKKRLGVLEKLKAEKKIVSKRTRLPGGGRASGPPPHRASKIQKFSSPYATYISRDKPSPASRLSPVSRYLAPYSYPNQTTYNSGVVASAYAPTPSYGAPHFPAAAPVAVPGADPSTQQYYGSQIGYGSYDYSAAATAAYRPPYPQ